LYGRCAAQALYEAGARVFTGSTNMEKLNTAVGEMRKEGGDVTAFHLDLGSEESILKFRDSVMEKAGSIDILVNNSVARPMPGYDAETDLWEQSMKVNATGNFIITRAFGKEMIRQKSGSIINIASIHGMIGPDPFLYEGLGMENWGGDYFYNKGGMISFTRFLASYYGRYGIRANAISPGGIRSYRTPDEFVRRYSQHTMLNRMAADDDIKGAVVFLASDASLYVTATNLPVDGGYTAK
jgi:NAD(P)-dependent dehydrogenase (short-subunit alcohol dehydrogenase family)